MRVTVINYLNVRVGEPSVNAPSYQYLSPGTVVEVEEVFYQGDYFESTNKWLRDVADNYYWAGAVSTTDLNIPSIEVGNVRLSYNKQLNVSTEIKATKGEGVTVAILDTGCFGHKALEGAIAGGYDSINCVEGSYNDTSLEGRGTGIAGIIAAREIDSNQIVGIAPKASLYVVRAIEDESISSGPILAGLKWLRDQTSVDIINLSFSLFRDTHSAEISEVLAELADRGTLIIGAGENGIHLFSNSIFYPANLPHVIAVGELGRITLPTGASLHEQINYIIPQAKYLSTSNYRSVYHDDFEGCGYASALVTAAVALALSYKRKSCSNLSPFELLNNQWPRFVLNNFPSKPYSVFKK